MNSLKTFNTFFKEYYYTGSLCEADKKLYYLIDRYEDKVSERLLKIKAKLWKEGEKEFNKTLEELIKGPNLLDLIIKDKIHNGSPYHQPVVLGLEHGITLRKE